ncbi:50S ribosomal protein L30e [Candidatus Bathyarchaeota archaeon]|nr:50S ribosomal protein L30e [Candidatus Bathyarchaeota archaeon]
MIDINKQLKILVKTGKVDFGVKQAIKAVKMGKTKMVIIASNCPENLKQEILYCAKTSSIPVYAYKGGSLDLGAACDKPFPISVLTIIEPGDSEILKLIEG